MTYLVPDLPSGAMHRAELIIRRSRFIVSVGRASTLQAAKAFVDRIKAEHPQANHNCWAFNAGAPEMSAQIGASDDGEPKGTAGRPMLNVLLHSGVGEAAVVVTRYFGGTLLGTGGLVRAYQELVKLGLQKLPVKPMVPHRICRTKIPLSLWGRAERAAQSAGAEILQKTFAETVQITLSVPEETFGRLAKILREMSGGACELKAVVSTDE